MSKLKILVLDDDKIRLMLFSKLGEKYGLDMTLTETAKEAIDCLKASEFPCTDEIADFPIEKVTGIGFDIIFLDHDLGGKIYVQSGKETGYEVVEYLCNLNPHLQAGILVVVHSFNPVGAENMMKLMEYRHLYCKRAPIGSDIFYKILEDISKPIF